jgi:hypothetical protein
MVFYKKCPDCGANLDPEEKCDCAPGFLISETYIVNFDISKYRQELIHKEEQMRGKTANGVSTLQIVKVETVFPPALFNGVHKIPTVINTLYGLEAERLYEKLTGIKIVKGDK